MTLTQKGNKMRLIYETPTAELLKLEAVDVITTSILEDTGDNDGEWTGFKMNGNKAAGSWS